VTANSTSREPVAKNTALAVTHPLTFTLRELCSGSDKLCDAKESSVSERASGRSGGQTRLRETSDHKTADESYTWVGRWSIEEFLEVTIIGHKSVSARILIEAATERELVARYLEELGHAVIVADPNFAPMCATRNLFVKSYSYSLCPTTASLSLTRRLTPYSATDSSRMHSG
jgi:hypothetical protein